MNDLDWDTLQADYEASLRHTRSTVSPKRRTRPQRSNVMRLKLEQYQQNKRNSAIFNTTPLFTATSSIPTPTATTSVPPPSPPPPPPPPTSSPPPPPPSIHSEKTTVPPQSSGMLLRQRLSTTLDDGLLPLYRPLLIPTDSVMMPVERENTIYLDSAGARHHTKHGNHSVRAIKYIRGSAMNDGLRIRDRPHGWRSPVARTRMQKCREAKERKLMNECTFQPELEVQRAAVAHLLRFKEKKNSVDVAHVARPKWNRTTIRRLKTAYDVCDNIDRRWVDAENLVKQQMVGMRERRQGAGALEDVPELYLSLHLHVR